MNRLPHLLLAMASIASLCFGQTRFAELHKYLDKPDGAGPFAFGDVDGDGDVDLVWGMTGAPARLYLNDGNGRFTPANSSQTPDVITDSWWHVVAFADVDGDRDLDLMLGDSIRNRLYLNNGKGRFTDVTSTHMPAG